MTEKLTTVGSAISGIRERISDLVQGTRVKGDTQDRLQILADGSIKRGDGTTAPSLWTPDESGVVAVKAVVRDTFTRPNQTINGTQAESGQTYRAIPDSRIVNGRLAALIPTSGNTASSYTRLPLGAPMRSMSAKWVYNPGTAGLAGGIALINTPDGADSFQAGNNWLHFSVSENGWDFSWTTRPAESIVFNYLDTGAWKIPLAKDGTTVYGTSMEIVGASVVLSFWNETTGQVLLARTVPLPAQAIAMNGNYCIWQPIQGAATFDSAEITEITASVKSSDLDAPTRTRGEIVKVVDARTSDPLGLGFAGNLPPFLPTTPQGVAANGWAWVSRLLADSAPNCQNIKLYVSTSSGNISVGVYRQFQSGSVVRLATSGAIPCPAVGAATIPLDVPVTARRETDFLAISIDNTVARIYGVAGSFLFIVGQALGLMSAGAHPLPAGPIGAAWGNGGTVHSMALVP